ncbi:chloride channel domain protein [Brucella abortus]|nr:chloride channel domain protein [Brucella abortus]
MDASGNLRPPAGRAAECGHPALSERLHRTHGGRHIDGRADLGSGALAQTSHRRPHRGERPPWRTPVTDRQFHSGRAEPHFQGLWRFGGAGSGLYAACERLCLTHRARTETAPRRHAHPRRLRRGGSHRQRLQCAADRLVLCLRAYHRRLFHRHTCPRRGRGHHRDACDAGHRRRTFHYRYRPDRRHHPARLCTGPHARLHFSGHRHSHHAWRYPGGKGRTAQRGAQCAGAGNRRRQSSA